MKRKGKIYIDISTDRWEPWTGCVKVSEGCKHCWAIYSLNRLKKKGISPYRDMAAPFHFSLNNNELQEPSLFDLPKNVAVPKRIWICDRSDPFFDEKNQNGEYLLPDEAILRAFDIMAQVPQHRFIVCTKRAERLAELGPKLPWKPWIWVAVTIESAKQMPRLEALKSCGALNKFIQFEPLLGKIPDFNTDGIDWLAVGGEAGPYARPMQADWVRHLRDMAQSSGIPFLFKSWSSFGGSTGRGGNKENILDGKRWDEFPPSLLTNIENTN